MKASETINACDIRTHTRHQQPFHWAIDIQYNLCLNFFQNQWLKVSQTANSRKRHTKKQYFFKMYVYTGDAIITSAKEVMFLTDFVCLSVH